MNLLEITEQQTHTFLDAMGYVRTSPTETREREQRVFVSVFVSRPRDLIGDKGATLRALQHLVRLAVVKRADTPVRVDVDVNHYKKKRAELLADFARHIGERVRVEQKAVKLEPMSAFDRRVVHSTLAEYTDLTTHSAGEEPHRYITVGPYNPS